MNFAENKEMSREDFQKAVKFNGWEVFTQDQIKNYGLFVGALISKSEKGDLNQDEQNALKTGQAELKNLQSVRVVEHVDGRIVKSLFFVQDPQVRFEDTLEKGEGNQPIQKGIFLDTPLNRELGRVGVEFEKGCATKSIKKTEEYEVAKALTKRGVEGVYDELKKAYPDMTDEKYNEIKKAMEEEESEVEEKDDDGGEEEKEEEEGGEEESEPSEEIQKAITNAINKINDNFNKGLIPSELATDAAEQLDQILIKGGHKYIKREGSPGNYKYYYTLEQYKKEHKADSTEDKKKEVKKEESKKESSEEVRSSDSVKKEIKDAPIGAKASGGGYSPWEKIKSGTWKNVKTGTLANNDRLFKEIASFDDFKVSGKEGGDGKEENAVGKDKDGNSLGVGDRVVYEQKFSNGKIKYTDGVITGKDELGNIKVKLEGTKIESTGFSESSLTKKEETKKESKEEPKGKEIEMPKGFSVGDKVTLNSDVGLTSLNWLKAGGEVVGSKEGTVTQPLFLKVKDSKGEVHSVNPSYVSKELGSK